MPTTVRLSKTFNFLPTFASSDCGNEPAHLEGFAGTQNSVEWIARAEGEKSSAIERRDELLKAYLGKSPDNGGSVYKGLLNKLLEFFNSLMWGDEQKDVANYDTNQLLMLELHRKVRDNFNDNKRLSGVCSYVPFEVFAGYAACVCAELLAQLHSVQDDLNDNLRIDSVDAVIKNVVDLAKTNLVTAESMINAELEKYPELKPSDLEKAHLIQAVMGNLDSAPAFVEEYKEMTMVRSAFHQEFFGVTASDISAQSADFTSKRSSETGNYQVLNSLTGEPASIAFPKTAHTVLGENERGAIAKSFQKYIQNPESRESGVECFEGGSMRANDMRYMFRDTHDEVPLTGEGLSNEEMLVDFQTKIGSRLAPLYTTVDEQKVAEDCVKALVQQGVVGAPILSDQDLASSFKDGQYVVSPSGRCAGQYTVMNSGTARVCYVKTVLGSEKADGFGISGHLSGQPVVGHVTGRGKIAVLLKLRFEEGNPIPTVECPYAATECEALEKQVFSYAQIKGADVETGEFALPEKGQWEITSAGQRTIEQSLSSRFVVPDSNDISSSIVKKQSDIAPFYDDINRLRFEFEYRDGSKRFIHCEKTNQSKAEATQQFEQDIKEFFGHRTDEERNYIADVFRVLMNQSMPTLVGTGDAKLGDTFSGDDFALSLGGKTTFTLSPGTDKDELVLDTHLSAILDCKAATINGVGGVKQLFTYEPEVSLQGEWTGRVRLRFPAGGVVPIISCEQWSGNWTVVKNP